MNDPNPNQSETYHEISSNDIQNSQIDASTNLEENVGNLNIRTVDSSISKLIGKIEARNSHKIKTGMKFENGNSSDRFYQFTERLLILLGFGSPTIYFLNNDWLKTYFFYNLDYGK